eukprot:CFRG1365T1
MLMVWQIVLFLAVATYAAEHEVSAGTSNQLYDAVQAAVAGDTVILRQGVHTVTQTVIVSKPLIIKGATNEQVRILASGITDLFRVTIPSSEVKFSNFELKGDTTDVCSLIEPLALDVSYNVDLTNPEIGDNHLVFEADFGHWYNHRWVDDFEYGECSIANDYGSNGRQAMSQYQFILRADCHGLIKFWFDFTKLEDCGIMADLKPTVVMYEGFMTAYFRENLYYQNALELLMVPLSRGGHARTHLCTVVSRVEKICSIVTVHQPQVKSFGNICGRTFTSEGNGFPIDDIILSLTSSDGYTTRTATSLDGQYCFMALPLAGGVSYAISASLPNGLKFVADYDSPPGSEIDGDAFISGLVPGETVNNVDFIYGVFDPDFPIPSCSDVQGSILKYSLGELTSFPSLSVRLLDMDGNVVATTLSTNPNGVFKFQCVEHGDYIVEIPTDADTSGEELYLVTDPDGMIDGMTTIIVTNMENQIDPFIFSPRSTISGITTTVDGIPISGVVIELMDSSGIFIATTVTDVSGNFFFTSVPDGSFIVLTQMNEGAVEEYDLLSESTLEVNVQNNQPVSSLTFIYGLPGKISGLILENDTEEPIEGTFVQLEGITDPTFKQTIITEQDGSFLFQNLPDGEYKILVPSKINEVGFISSAPEDNDGAPEQTTVAITATVKEVADIIFKYKAPGIIKGSTLEDISNQPIMGETCILTSLTDTTFPAKASTTNSDGLYEFTDLSDGTYKVACPKEVTTVGPISTGPTDSDTIFEETTVSITADDRVIDGLIFKYHPYGTVSGKTQDAAGGVPLVDVTCTLQMQGNSSFSEMVISDENGIFKVTGLYDGTYAIICPEQVEGKSIASGPEDDENFPFSTVFTIGPDNRSVTGLVFEYLSSGTVSGTTRDAIGGVPLVDVTCTLQMQGNTSFSEDVTSDVNGNFKITGLHDGTYALICPEEVEGKSIASGPEDDENFPFSTVFTIGPDNRSVTDLVFEYLSPGTLSGKILEDIGDVPIMGTTVVLISLTDESFPDRIAITDADGKYSFETLPQGRYRVVVPEEIYFVGPIVKGPPKSPLDSPDELFTSVQEITVDNRSVTNVDFEYTIPGVVYGAILEDIPGGIDIPVEGISCTLSGTSAVFSTQSDVEGNFKFVDIPNGQYTLECPDRLDDIRTISAGPQDADGVLFRTDVVIDELNRASFGNIFEYMTPGKISGFTLEDDSETPIAGVICTLNSTQGSFSASSVTNDNGMFEFNGLPDGEYTVMCPTEVNGVGNVSKGPSDADGKIYETTTIINPTVRNVNDLTFEYMAPGTISGRTYHFDLGDSIADILCTLTGLEGFTMAVVTQADGSYSFINIPDGDYIVSCAETKESYKLFAGPTDEDGIQL